MEHHGAHVTEITELMRSILAKIWGIWVPVQEGLYMLINAVHQCDVVPEWPVSHSRRPSDSGRH